MAKKLSRQRFVLTREFINKDGKLDTYIERRGIREIKRRASTLAGTKSVPRAQEVAQHLSIAALAILKKAGEKAHTDVIERVKQESTTDEGQAIKSALIAWNFDITFRYGILSPVTLAADFLGQLYLITGSFADGLLCKQADRALNDITRSMQQVFAFCDTWHWLHMEIYGEHRHALDGARSTENLRAAAPARTKRKKERVWIVRQLCEAYWAKSDRVGFRNASRTAQRLRPTVNERLKQAGHQTYTAESLEKLVREISRETETSVT